MNSVSNILLFLGLIFFSLIVVSFVNRIQTRSRMVGQKVRQLRRRLDELEEICAAIEPLLESVLIPKIVNEEVLDLIKSISQLDPRATFVDVKRENALALDQTLARGERTQPLFRALSSDAAIARSKYYIKEAARIVRRHHSIGRLDATEMETHIRELTWAHCMVEVISLLVQGHKAVNRNETAIAFGYYRKAQNILLSSKCSEDRCHRFIRELTEIMEGKRLSISTDLMPESNFNPKVKPNFGDEAATSGA